MFDWEGLRHFSAFVRGGSLSAAAKELSVDHATLARTIASLQAALQLKLVDKFHGRGNGATLSAVFSAIRSLFKETRPCNTSN
jgi:DNA-binding transcriptional LysR family regulator